jgi:HSP20 family protein
MADPKSTSTDQQRTSNEQLARSAQRRDRSLARREEYDPFWSAYASPFQLMRRMSEEMDRLFGRVFEEPRGERGYLTPSSAFWAPKLETFQKGDKFIVRAELPGIDKNDVQVEVTEGQATIQGERRQEHDEESEGVFRSERSYGSFYRTVPLPEGVIPESAEASFRNGVLEIAIQAPPKTVNQPRRLEIKEVSEEARKQQEKR